MAAESAACVEKTDWRLPVIPDHENVRIASTLPILGKNAAKWIIRMMYAVWECRK